MLTENVNNLCKIFWIVKAAKGADSVAIADAEKRWYANANQMAVFLSSINPYWPAQEWRMMFYDYFGMVKNLVASILEQIV